MSGEEIYLAMKPELIHLMEEAIFPPRLWFWTAEEIVKGSNYRPSSSLANEIEIQKLYSLGTLETVGNSMYSERNGKIIKHRFIIAFHLRLTKSE